MPAELVGNTKPSPPDASTPLPRTLAESGVAPAAESSVAPPQTGRADTASPAVAIPPVSIDVAHDVALSERRAWHVQVWALRTSLFFAVCGVIVGLVFVIGAFRFGVIDCFWDSLTYVTC